MDDALAAEAAGDLITAQRLLLGEAAKPGAAQAAAFAGLGRIYSDKDATRALKCFARAVALDAAVEEGGRGLVRSLAAAGQHDALAVACEAVLGRPSAAVGPRWAVEALPFALAAAGRHDDAIPAAQRALRETPTSAPLWECLAGSYAALGRSTAAARAYERCVTLHPGRRGALCGLASLQLAAGDVTGAAGTYAALAAAGVGAPASAGAASALLCSARNARAEGALGRSRTCAAEGMAHAAAAAAASPGSTIPHVLRAHLLAESHLTGGPTAPSPHEAARACLRRVHKSPCDSTAWSDAAIGWLLAAAPVGGRVRDSEIIDAAASRASRAARSAAVLEPSSTTSWAVLAAAARLTPAVGGVELAEHAGLRAAATAAAAGGGAPAALAWSSLGVLYLGVGDMGRAHGAFERARLCDADCPAAWAGMATLETISGGGAATVASLWLTAVELGGGAPSRLGYALTSAAAGEAMGAAVYSASRHAASLLPDLAVSHASHAFTAAARCLWDEARSAVVKVTTALVAEGGQHAALLTPLVPLMAGGGGDGPKREHHKAHRAPPPAAAVVTSALLSGGITAVRAAAKWAHDDPVSVPARYALASTAARTAVSPGDHITASRLCHATLTAAGLSLPPRWQAELLLATSEAHRALGAWEPAAAWAAGARQCAAAAGLDGAGARAAAQEARCRPTAGN